MMLKSRKTILLLLLVALTSVAIGFFTHHRQHATAELPKFGKAIILPIAKPISGVNFTDHRGNPFSADQLLGKWSILFFGFTNCPDICPTTMHTLKQVKDKVSAAKRWHNFQVVMVSVDPLRDTPAQLANYVPFFDTEFIGISGDIETTSAFTKQLGILFVAQDAQSNGAYEVDHSTALILLNPKGEMAGLLSAPHNADVIGADLISLADFYVEDHEADPTRPEFQPEPISNVLRIDNAWIRPAPPTVDSMAGYFDLINTSELDIKLVELESPQFETVMLHDTVIQNGVASMRHKDVLLIPAHSKVSLSPMATHVMLMRPESSMPLGSVVDLNLITDDGRIFNQKINVQPQPEIK